MATGKVENLLLKSSKVAVQVNSWFSSMKKKSVENGNRFRIMWSFFVLLTREYNSFDELHRKEETSLGWKVIKFKHSNKFLNLQLFRVFWIVAFLFSITSCSLLVYKTYQRWKNDPMIVTFKERSTPAWEVSLKHRFVSKAFKAWFTKLLT